MTITTPEELVRLIAGMIDAAPYMEGPTAHAKRKAENIISALSAAGVVLVPEVATERMLEDADHGTSQRGWARMLNASPFKEMK